MSQPCFELHHFIQSNFPHTRHEAQHAYVYLGSSWLNNSCTVNCYVNIDFTNCTGNYSSNFVGEIPHSGKLLSDKTSANFAYLCYSREFSSRNLGVWCPLAQHKQPIRESFLRENHQFAKFFSLISFPSIR